MMSLPIPVPSTLPTLGAEEDISRYLRQINQVPSLEVEEEWALSKRFLEEQDLTAAQRLVLSHLKLVPKIARHFRGYGLPLWDLIAEGNIGLMQAVKRFNPDLGYRLSTYAMWWIKASIQHYIIRSWSLVKIGTTAAQKKLFFNLNKVRRTIWNMEGRPLTDGDTAKIATMLNVAPQDVTEMSIRLSGGGDVSLNDTLYDREGNTSSEMIELLEAPEEYNQELFVLKQQELAYKRGLLYRALETLNPREQGIVTKRRLHEPPVTLKALSEDLGISCERVRQLEERAVEKMTLYIAAHHQDEPRLLPLKLLPQAARAV